MQIPLRASVIVLVGCAGAPTPSPPVRLAVAGIDCHMHVPPDGSAADRATQLLQALDAASLSHGCVFSRGSHAASDQHAFAVQMNDDALAVARHGKGRLLGFCSVPILADFAPDEVTRCAGAGGKGLKLHLFNEKVSLASDENVARLDAIFARAARHGLPTVIHVLMDDAAEVRAFFTLAERHPAATFIAAHQIAPNIALLPEAPANVSIDISGLPHAPAEAGSFFVPAWRAFGIRRVIFGSDWPYLSPAEHVERIAAYPLTDAERAQILTNARRLLGL